MDRTSYHKRDRTTQYGRLKTYNDELVGDAWASIRAPALNDRLKLSLVNSWWKPYVKRCTQA